MNDHVFTSRPLTLSMQFALGIALTYLITVHTLAAYLADEWPAAALRLNGSQPFALIRLAERELPSILGTTPPDAVAEEGSSSRLEGFARLPRLDLSDGATANTASSEPPAADDALKARVREQIQRALSVDPLNARGLSLLGALAIGANDDAEALKFMMGASKLSGHIPLANYWLLRSNYEAKNYAEALRHADRLLRSTPLNIQLATPYLGRIADASLDDMAAMLATNPPWRANFFYYLKGNIKDPRTPLHLLLRLKETDTPPTVQEFGPYVSLLYENSYLDLAYSAWLQSLSPEQLTHAGFIYNGGFDYDPAKYPFPFDWSLQSGQGVIADTVRLEDANSALMLKFGPGRVAYKPVTQTTKLIPGSYTLSARHRGSIKSRRGLRWIIECAAKVPVQIGQSDELNGAYPQWSVVKVPFSVPSQDCPAQRVKLILDARSASEMLVSGELLVDDVTVERRAEPPQ